MRESGSSCPARFGSLERDATEVLDERPEFLDLSCHYSAPDITVTVFVTRFPDADFQHELGAAERVLREQNGAAREIRAPVPFLGPGRFDAGKCWLSGDANSCITFRRQGDFVIQLRVNYGSEGAVAARNAIRAIENHAFPRGIVGH